FMRYSPNLGWMLYYPFDDGWMQNSADITSDRLDIGVRDWGQIVSFKMSDLDLDPHHPVNVMLNRVGVGTPIRNKYGTVVSVSEARVIALYQHDEKVWIITYSYHNLLRKFGNSLLVQDLLEEERCIWSYRREEEGWKVAEAAAAMLTAPDQPVLA